MFIRMAELLAAAGVRPTIYKNVVATASAMSAAEYAPLRELPGVFDLEGRNR
jgi:hypothetical protein